VLSLYLLTSKDKAKQISIANRQEQLFGSEKLKYYIMHGVMVFPSNLKS